MEERAVKKTTHAILFAILAFAAKGEPVTLQNIGAFRYHDPLFESVRVALNAMGETYTPEYIQGISGAAFKIATGCPSRPTCVHDGWPAEFLKYLGYEIEEHPCFDADKNDITDKMVEAVKRHIDAGKPALVWHAFTEYEWDVVAGYDNEARQFIGCGAYKGLDDYARAPWDRAKNAFGFGAILIGKRIAGLDERAAELRSIENTIKHARHVRTEDQAAWDFVGVECYKKWAAKYAAEGAARDQADLYCHMVYSSVRKAGVGYLREIAPKYDDETAGHLRAAADCFEREAGFLEDARPFLGLNSLEGVDEERSKKLAPLLAQAADAYEKAIEHLEKINRVHATYR
jgi:hypothetical protein